MLKAAGVVTLVASLVTLVTDTLDADLPFDLAVDLLLTYFCGRRILKIECRPALCATLIYGAIVLTLVFTLTS